MKSKQFCSVCKQWLDMEIVPTGDGEDDDGVVWFRCPQCQGFLPKLSSQLEDAAAGENSAAAPESAPAAPADDPGEDMPWDSPADMMAARDKDAADGEGATAAAPAAEPDQILDDIAATSDPDADPGAAAPPVEPGEPEEDAEAPEPLAEYAALLAEKDVATAVPYRPWETYEVGQCVHHLAWDDCGVVVAKEDLPGGRKVIKCYFAEAGVVRLIEEAPR